MPTIQDVARVAGVSTATVSRYIHNSPKVLEATRKKVAAAIKKLNYHPNVLARQFRTQKTGDILIMVPELANTFYHDIISGVQSVAATCGYHILIAEIHNDPALEEYFFESLIQKQIDGIITFSAMLPPKKLEKIVAQYPIVVACRYYENMQIPSVAIDNRRAARDITGYIFSLGHKDICYLSGDPDIVLYQDRKNGYLDAVREQGIEADPARIIVCEPNIQGGFDAVSELLETDMKFSAIVSSGDTMAIGAIEALKEHGKIVPLDVAVTGFDDIQLASLYSPSLTTVQQPKYDIGVRSITKLLDMINKNPHYVLRECVGYEILVRESTKGTFLPAV